MNKDPETRLSCNMETVQRPRLWKSMMLMEKNDVFHLDLFWDWGLKNDALEIDIYFLATDSLEIVNAKYNV